MRWSLNLKDETGKRLVNLVYLVNHYGNSHLCIEFLI